MKILKSSRRNPVARGNPVARVVRTPAFRSRIVPDKRARVREREARRTIREHFGDRLTRWVDLRSAH